jgi:hypothetical protein
MAIFKSNILFWLMVYRVKIEKEEINNGLVNN